MTQPAPWRGRLGIVGIGLDGLSGISPRGRLMLSRAQTIVGSPRQLELLADMGSRQLIAWQGDLSGLARLLQGRDGSQTVMIASGDPNLFGIGATFAGCHGSDCVDIEPAVSSLLLALARLGLPAADAGLVSAHGRSLEAAAALAVRRRHAAILTAATPGPLEVVRALLRAGADPASSLWSAERLGAADELIRAGTLSDPPPQPYDLLCVLVISQPYAIAPLIGAAEQEYLQGSGRITKSETRALALASLRIAADDVVWDLGSGTGSVAIEAGRCAHYGAVYAVERDPARVDTIKRNIEAHGAWNVHCVEADATKALEDLPDPNAVFIGGGGRDLEPVVHRCLIRLRPVKGRLVAACATIESTLEAVRACRQAGSSHRVLQLQVSRAMEAAGRLRWQANNPVQLVVVDGN